MISCLETSIVTTRKSIFTMRSTIGIRKMSPGPFAPRSLPQRKMTPRSYSRRIRTHCGRRTARTMMATTKMMTRGVTVLMVSSIVLRFGFYFQFEPVDRDDLHRLIFFHRHIAHRGPVFAFHKNPPAAGIDAFQRRRDFADHRLLPGAHRQLLRPQTAADR